MDKFAKKNESWVNFYIIALFLDINSLVDSNDIN